MNPLHIARVLRDDYLTLLRTTFRPRQESLRDAFDREIERDGFLTREPFISLAQPYQRGEAQTWMCDEAQRRFGAIARTPYLHQAMAAERISRGEPAVVATGTGSGKTEAFLMPIVDWCLRHRDEDVLKAILIYPMNALATDQLRRVRGLLAGSGVTFGRYTGETHQAGARPAEAPEEERVNRAEFRAHPPHILLTNYQMLEYMLLRGDGRDIFRNHRVRFVVLDEVHTYHGALGTDVACLLRRLRAALSGGHSQGNGPLFIGTSATLQSEDGQHDPRAGVATFFSRLTGQQTPPEAVITEALEPPVVPTDMVLPVPPAITDDELDAVNPGRPETVLALARRLAGRHTGTLEDLWAGLKLPHLLMSWLTRPMSIDDVVEHLRAEPEREGVAEDALRREIEAALLVGPCLDDGHPLRLRPRVHRFLRGLARFWRCTNPECGSLVHEGIEACTTCGARTLPLAICRTCGWDFLMGRDSGGQIQPWGERTSTRQTVYLYDDPGQQVQTDAEEEPFENDGETDADTGNGEAGEEGDGPAGREGDAFLCPQCLGMSDSADERACTCGDHHPLRPVRIHHGRGTRCPVCNSRYGRFDVLTPVSLGNSSALTHVSRTLLRELPEENRKLLVFCDSRQDAAHQARFIEGVEGHLRLRRAVYRFLRDDGDAHDLHWLVERIYHGFVDQGMLPRTRSRDAQRREMDMLEGALLAEFVLASNVRHSVERLGLVEVRYAELDRELAARDFAALCGEHHIDVARGALAARRLLDFMRGRFAVDHEAFRTRLYRGDRLSNRYGMTPGRQVGLPVAFREPGNRTDNTSTYKLTSTWNESGPPAGTQRLWRQLLGEEATTESLSAMIGWLSRNDGWLRWSRIGRNADEIDGFQVATEMLEFRLADRFVRCDTCGRTAPGEQPGIVCPRPGCDGHLVDWEGPLAEGNLNAMLVAAEYSPALMPAEHSAAVNDDRRLEVEEGFQAHPPRFNVLVCTPTLELGVNIGDLEAVTMRNIPPSPANYAQRSGRTGRQSRMGLSVGFARKTPHDGYFFDHPDEVIAGAIPPPRFNLANLEAIARHVRSLVLEEAQLEYPANLETLISDTGALNAGNLRTLVQHVAGARDRASRRAREVFGSQLSACRNDWEMWLGGIIQQAPDQIEAAIQSRAALVEDAVRRMRELGQQVRQTQRQQDAEQGYRNLARKLREDYRYAYLPRVLAEAGVLPGYSFPGDPGSLSLSYDPDPIFAGRLQAQREFVPGQIVYARGHRWRVGGIAMNRPGSRTQGTERFEFTECPACGLAAPARGMNNCPRCGAELGGEPQTAWDSGAFQAWPADVEPETEEERLTSVYDVRVHPQRDVPAHRYTIGPWTMELRSQEEIWWVNHGPLQREDGEDDAQPQGFRLCQTCGELRRERHQPQQGQRRNRDPRAERDPHDDRCGGQAVTVSIGHQTRADTLRLLVPNLAELGEEGIAWAWSLAWSIVRGSIRLFDLDEDDLEVRVLTRREDGREEVMEIVWVDSILGGSGILREVATRLPEVARSALEHLRDHECPSSCYRCLRTYRNQRIHGQLDWRLVVAQLRAASVDVVEDRGEALAPPQQTRGPEWDEARTEGCGSPIELRLLRAMRENGLPEPVKQHEIHGTDGRLLTAADFAYPDQRLLIYVDGLAFHSSLRQRVHDSVQSNQLLTMGFRVLRFLGVQIYRETTNCVQTIRSALGE